MCDFPPFFCRYMIVQGDEKGARISDENKRNAAKPSSAWRVRLWRYGPVVAWACFVLFASSANFSASNTSRIIRPLLIWLFPDITEASLAEAHFLVRKAAHVTEYAILALLAARAFRTSSREALRERWWLAAFALVAVVALVDEWHQSTLASRTGSIYDSLLDMTGGALALVCAAIWVMRRRKKVVAEVRSG